MALFRTLKLLFYFLIFVLAIRGTLELISKKQGRDSIYVMTIGEAIVLSEKFIRELRSIEGENDVKAVIVRINSPGGTVGASQELFLELERFKSRTGKKLVCSIENIGASGAYYVSLACDRIIALPGSIVGSIGVISIFFTAEELLEKIRIRPHIIKTGGFKDTGTPLRKATEGDIRYLQGVVNELFEQFKDDVRRKRPISATKIDEISDGRVFSGREAYNLGLIDQLGTFSDAITVAKELAGIKGEPKIIWRKRGRLELIEEMLGDRLKGLLMDLLSPLFL